jgi:hypothetical protein
LVRLRIIAAVLAVAVSAPLLARSTPAVTAAAPRVTLLYVGADDCGPCRVWHTDDRPAFLTSAEFAHLQFREIRSPSLFELLKDDYWPDDLRSYRQGLDRGTGVPLWLVLADDEVVLRSSGISQWRRTVLPKIRALLR